MTEHEKLEKVIKGLRCCRNIGARLEDSCNICPYQTEKGRTCYADELFYDAIALLKAQEPRVMTFAEVKKHYNLPPVFIDDLEMQEDYYQDIQPLYFEFPNQCAWDVHWRGSNQAQTYLDEWEDRYNKTWRCWTSRPDQAAREATPWN